MRRISKNSPDLNTVLENVKRDVSTAINCTQIGTIQSYDSGTQLATIKIALKQVVSISDDGVKSIREYPMLIECPVFTLYGGADFISMPITSGDSCIIMFCDKQIDNWLNSGDGHAPNIDRVHDLSDGIALVGIKPLTDSISGIISDGISINHNNGSSKIDLKDNLIESTAILFDHTGNCNITGNVTVNGSLTILGTTFGTGGGSWVIDADIDQVAGRSIHAGNGASGTFTQVTVVDGIVISGT